MITAIEIAALRKADRVCFFHISADRSNCPRPGASFIRAIKAHKLSVQNPFEDETSVEVECEWRVQDYTEGDRIPYASGAFDAFEMIHSAQISAEWQTIASLLRAGDRLTLLWSRGGWTTQGMKGASPALYGDSLSLLVERGAKQRFTFHVGHTISENNSARMVRRGAF